MRLLLALRVIPIGTNTPSLSKYVAEVINVLKELGYEYILSPFNTSIEIRDPKELSRILEQIIERIRSLGVERVAIDINIDARFDKEISLEYKIRAVEEKIRQGT